MGNIVTWYPTMPSARGRERLFVPDVGVIFVAPSEHVEAKDRKSYRVFAWLCEATPPDENASWLEAFLFDAQPAIDGKKLAYCTREEATHVAGMGEGRCVRRVDEIEVVGRVSWSEEQIVRARQNALRLIGRLAF